MIKSTENGASLDLSDRARRLARVVAKADIAADYPLLKVIRIAGPAFERLEGAVMIYVWHTLSRAYPDRIFTLGRDMLADYAREILALPNRTPNGVVLPRLQTFLSFNLIHQALAEILDSTGMLTRFSRLQLPCNVRLVEGTPDRQADARSYSSTKIHTDVWNGEPISSILFNIPVLGDPEGADLRFYEPCTFPATLRVPLTDYTLGNDVAANVIEYPVAFEMRNMYISDALSLHQTIKRRACLRLSLDFRTIARELLPGEAADFSASRAVYVLPETWKTCGSTTILGSGDPVDAFQRRQAGEKVLREPMSIVSVDEPLDPPGRQ